MKTLSSLIFISFLLTSINVDCQNISFETTVDSLNSEIESLKKTNFESLNSIDSLQQELKYKKYEISISDTDKLKSVLEKNWSIYDAIPSIVAIIVVFISTLGAYRLGLKQIKKQEENSKEQIRNQQSIAQDQLEQSRKQIEATSKMTLAQVRANNISQARINWVENLRDNLSLYVSELVIVSYLVNVLHTDKTSTEDERKLTETLKNIRIYESKIRLYLNTNRDDNNHTDSDHINLENLIEKARIKAVSFKSIENGNELNEVLNDIILLAKKVLKTAWEQAKSEGQDFKID